jgi:soluble lytic murein transglycosylase-like protein
MGVRPRERAGEAAAGGGGRRPRAPRAGSSLATPTPRRSATAPRAPRRVAKPAAATLRPRATVSWGYRALEQIVSSAAVAVTALAVLTLALTSPPTVFIATLTATALSAALAMVGLERARRRTPGRWRHALNLAVVVATVVLAMRAPPWTGVRALGDLLAHERGTELRVVAHQVYAAYRRMDLAGQRDILRRAEVYEPSIREASDAFGLNDELLMGIAATESSFNPRPSRDGGQGLFQITSVPRRSTERAQEVLGVDRLDPLNQKHNAFVAAATLADYADKMNGDLLLTLLAYNIGPHNGGLEFIMKQYGARNFAQVQPYLQTLPRDYPIRVLAGALAFRVWQSFGDLPRFEEGEWAARIRELGIPGLEEEARIAARRR